MCAIPALRVLQDLRHTVFLAGSPHRSEVPKLRSAKHNACSWLRLASHSCLSEALNINFVCDPTVVHVGRTRPERHRVQTWAQDEPHRANGNESRTSEPSFWRQTISRTLGRGLKQPADRRRQPWPQLTVSNGPRHPNVGHTAEPQRVSRPRHHLQDSKERDTEFDAFWQVPLSAGASFSGATQGKDRAGATEHILSSALGLVHKGHADFRLCQQRG
ncbi:hypothetical protein ARTHRO9AX_160018 [Arthrobacter sp. 9AX]|nr:hypothetical protein ARTHRO9AX_160018 [Arthrobacter sp. 9AX]